MYINDKEVNQAAVLVAVDTGEYDVEVSLNELEELADTAGAQVVGRIVQNLVKHNPATFVGSGKLEEIKEFCDANEVELLIFDHELSPTQIKNLEKFTSRTIIDRTMLILDIFAQRALTKEGKLQVEIAQQKYLLPRLIGLGNSLSRLAGGIGTRGPGESKLETDRRHIRRRIESLNTQLRELETHQAGIREKRKKDDVATVAIVGYTNAGKSTLLNALTGADVFAEDKLFATLDLTSRAMELPDGSEVILVDTVGFIRRLPHHLIEAFKSTLSEAVSASVILNVCDASSDEASTHLEVTQTLLSELGVNETPIITIYNKCDRLEHEIPELSDNVVAISAKTGFGFEKLRQLIADNLSDRQKRMRLAIPYDSAAVVALIRKNGKILSEQYTESGLDVEVLVDTKLLHLLSQYSVGD